MIAPPQRTRAAPKRSAIAPAKGWPIPHRRFCTARVNEKTSRPQPCSTLIGVRNKPSVDRGPKLTIDTSPPHRMMTAGTRQPIDGTGEIVKEGLVITGLVWPHRHSPNET